MATSFEQLRQDDQLAVRAKIRSGAYCEHTSGLANGFLQANLVILEQSYALDFMRFCQRNPKPCPLVGVTDTGSPFMRTLGADIDIRSDVPSYHIYRHGVLDGTVGDITDLWNDQMVGFALGCSFTFEHALIRAGIPVWHIDHVIPLSQFDLLNEEEQLLAFNWRNTMPLSATENLKKNKRIDIAQIDEHLKKLEEYHTIKNIIMPENFKKLYATYLDAGTS